MSSYDPATLSLDTQSYLDELKGKVNAAAGDVQAQIYAETGVDTSNARVQQGAAATLDLAQNGYNPNSKEDSAKLIHAISGGLCLVPGVGLILGGAVEGLWAVGNAIATPVQNAFASIGLGDRDDAPPCQSSGNWTPALILSINKGRLPATPKGSFAQFVIAALAMYAAQSSNCKGGFPPSAVVDGALAIWNKTHYGPAIPYYVPPLAANAQHSASVSPYIIPTWDKSSDKYAGSVDPNAFFAFGPAALGQPHALVKDITNPATWGLNVPFTIAPASPNFQYHTDPRVIMVNTGATIPQSEAISYDHSSSVAYAQTVIGAAVAAKKLNGVAQVHTTKKLTFSYLYLIPVAVVGLLFMKGKR